VAHETGAVVELEARCAQEAAARERAVAKKRAPPLRDRPQPWQPGLLVGDLIPDGGAPLRDRAVERLELQRLLGAEMADDTGLAHPHVGGEPPDREPLEAVGTG